MKQLFFVEITDTFGGERYDSKSGAACAFIREYDKQTDSDYLRFDSDDRKKGE